MKKIYNKLIRDKIPDVCLKDGWIPKYYPLKHSRFKKELKKKLVEEAKELLKAKSKEIKNEIVDCYEILLNVAKTYRIKWPEIDDYRRQKNKKRGSFRKRYFLVSTKKVK